jgi:hypothetical protein
MVALASALAICAPVTAGAADAPHQQSLSRNFLTPQQRVMLMFEYGGKWRAMSAEERQATRARMRDQWLAMSENDREKRRSELQARWDALPQVQKDAINARIAQRAAHAASTAPQGTTPQ